MVEACGWCLVRTSSLVVGTYTSHERLPTMCLPMFGSVWTSTSPHAGSSESELATISDWQVGVKLEHSNGSRSYWLFLFLLLWVMGAHLTGCAGNHALPDYSKDYMLLKNECFPVLCAAYFAFICLYASQCGCEKHSKCAVSALLWTFQPNGPDAALWQRLTQKRFIIGIALGVHLRTLSSLPLGKKVEAQHPQHGCVRMSGISVPLHLSVFYIGIHLYSVN